jgi:hypothetical protein
LFCENLLACPDEGVNVQLQALKPGFQLASLLGKGATRMLKARNEGWMTVIADESIKE